MVEAVRDVTIRLNVVPGDIQKIDLSKIQGQATGIQQTYAEQIRSMTTMAEQQRALAATDANRLTVLKQQATVAQSQVEYARQAADVQRLIRPLTEPGQPRAITPAIPPSVANAGKPGGALGEADTSWLDEMNKGLDSGLAKVESLIEKKKRLLGQESEAARLQADNQQEIQRQQLIIDLRMREKEVEKEIAAEADKRIQQIRRSELRAVRDRIEDEERATQARMTGAERTLQRIRVSELRNVRDRAEEEQRANERRMNEAQRTLQRIRVAELANVREIAAASEQAQRRMPVLARGIQQDISQTISGVAQLIGHLAMLESIGGDSVEAIARQFIKLQSSIQVINSTSSIFNNASEGLGRMRQMGDAVQDIVRQQQALGVATTFTQAATLRMAGAAGTLQAALGPIGLIATGITAAIVAADFAMTAFGANAEEERRRAEEHLDTYNRRLDDILRKLGQQTDMLNGQTNILETQWKIREMMAGGQLNPSQMKSQMEQQQALADTQATNNLRKSLTTMFKEGQNDELKIEQQKLDAERKTLIDERKDLERRDNNTGAFSVAIARVDRDLQELNQRQLSLNQQSGLNTVQALQQTQIKDGKIVDFEKFQNNLDNLPLDMRDEAGQFLAALQKDLTAAAQKSIADNQRASSQAQAAENTVLQSQREIDARSQRQMAEQELASRYSGLEGQFARSDAERALTEMAGTQDVDQRRRLAEQAQQSLNDAGLMTPALRESFQGSRTNAAVVLDKIKDDSQYDQSEQTADDQAIEVLTAAKQKADAQRTKFVKLAEDIERSVEENARQLEAISRAIAIRDGF